MNICQDVVFKSASSETLYWDNCKDKLQNYAINQIQQQRSPLTDINIKQKAGTKNLTIHDHTHPTCVGPNSRKKTKKKPQPFILIRPTDSTDSSHK